MRTYILRPRTAAPRPAADLQLIPAAKHAGDAACPDAGWKPLSKEQKARLSILARKAAEVQGITGGYRAVNEWRHEVSLRACGLRISEATQANWADLKSAFEDLGGQPAKAFQTQMREGDNKRRVALWKLTQALAGKGLQPAYAESICRCQFKCGLEQASAKQLWCLFYTITNRRKQS